MRTTKFFLMAALALTFAACSNDDNDMLAPGQTQMGEGIPFRATISIGESAATRALSESGSGLEATWAVGERVAMIHNGVSDEMEVESVSGGVATITGTVTGSPSDGDDVTVIYPYDAADGATGNVRSDVLANQNGILTGTGGTSIAEKYDVRKGTGKLKVSGGEASLKGNLALDNQFCIFKLTLKDIEGSADVEAQYMRIYNQDNEELTLVKPAAGYSKVMYVALPTTATTLKFAVTTDAGQYFNMASGLTLSASYYQSTVKLATVGDVILPSGKCAKAGTSGAVAMIGYLGKESNCTNGLALQLNSSPVKKNYADAKTYAEGLTAIPGGTWRLPTIGDLTYMMKACKVVGDLNVYDTKLQLARIDGFKNKILANGITWPTESNYYWTDLYDGDRYYAQINLDGTNADARFTTTTMLTTEFKVLGCLAF